MWGKRLELNKYLIIIPVVAVFGKRHEGTWLMGVQNILKWCLRAQALESHRLVLKFPFCSLLAM